MAKKERILVKEKIADSGVELLKQHFDVDLGLDWSDEQLHQKIGDYSGIVIRSATQLTEEMIEDGDALKIIARAGIGVDNIDVEAATKRGIIVANAPQANIIAAAEHTVALMLALARQVPQAHISLTSGHWERSKFAGVEVYEKTLGVVGFGRIGQLVAERAKAFGMHLIGFDPFVSSERFRELGVEKMETAAELYERADFITIHLPRTDQTRGWLNAEAFAQMKDGVRIINCARGELVDDAALKDALDSGKVGGAAIDVFPQEPITDHPLFHNYPNVVVTPHLGASTTEAQDRAGVQAAEQIVAALTGGVVTTAVNIPTVGAEQMKVLRPFLPLCERIGCLGMGLVEASSIDALEIEFIGKVAELDTRLLTIAVLNGALRQFDEDVNYVNAHSIADERGIKVSETKNTSSEDFTELVRLTVVADGTRVSVAGTGIGPRNLPHLVEAWDQRFNVELEGHISLFRYRDVPGMIGRIGTVLGTGGINISSAAVGREPENGSHDDGRLAAMVVTTDGPVPDELIDEIVSSEEFFAGRSLSL